MLVTDAGMRYALSTMAQPARQSIEAPLACLLSSFARIRVRMSNSAVLVLNQNYEPLNVCNAQRAFVLVDRGKAEILEHAEGAMRSAFQTFPCPPSSA